MACITTPAASESPAKRRKAKESVEDYSAFDPPAPVTKAPGSAYNPFWYDSPLHNSEVQKFFRAKTRSAASSKRGRDLARTIRNIAVRAEQDYLALRKKMRDDPNTASDWDGGLSEDDEGDDSEGSDDENPFCDSD